MAYYDIVKDGGKYGDTKRRIMAVTEPMRVRPVFVYKAKRSYRFLCNSLIFNVAGVGNDPTTSGL